MVMSTTNIRTPTRATINRLLFTTWVVFGTGLINRYVFNRDLSSLGFGLLMALVILIAYPVFGRRRNSPWRRVGHWTFAKWFIFATTLGAIFSVVEFLIGVAVNYLTT
jgi:FtsH-binding integral membrane protein